MHSCFSIGLVSFLTACTLSATPAALPNFSGNWKLDPAKSPSTHGDEITLTIKDEEGKITYERDMRANGGKEIVYKFSCAAGRTDCPFDENGHKAKVSLWYDGAALVILKTEGSKQVDTTERKLELSADGKTLTVNFTNLAGNNKPDTLVFSKQ